MTRIKLRQLQQKFPKKRTKLREINVRNRTIGAFGCDAVNNLGRMVRPLRRSDEG
ncbi:hypothetical protein [Novosphingobium sp.]|uniref:hypothetical protein n=1 Tax=Novosphingobium sp. TaxID=1874826 RepID=UPI0027325A02|nr:hypothetical protein [Novosphingobium sp.]